MTDSGKSTPFWRALGIAWELGYVIAIPIVVLGLGGRFLDSQFGTTPWLFLAGVVLSIILTTFALIWKFKKLLRSIEEAGLAESRRASKPPTKL